MGDDKVSIKDTLLGMHSASKKVDKKVNLLADVTKTYIGTLMDDFAPQKFLRASSLFNACPREFVFRQILPRPAPVISTGNVNMVLSMSVGSYLHWYFQNCVLGPAGVLVGTWQCWMPDPKEKSLCRKVVFGYRPEGDLPDINDPQSMLLNWTFVEEGLYSEEFGITGHIDGVVDTVAMEAFTKKSEFEPIDFDDCHWKDKIPKERLALLEIKSTNDNVLRTIKEDGVKYLSEQYRCQATIYQRLKGYDSTLFLYVDRKFFQFVGFEYFGEDSYWDLARVRGTQVQASIMTKELPPRILGCPFASAKRAKECIYCEVCFSEEPDLVFAVMEEMNKELGKLPPPDPVMEINSGDFGDVE